MEAYTDQLLQNETKVIADTKIFERELPDRNKSDRSQVLQGQILLVGMKDYGKWVKHLYTYTWAEADTAMQRERKLLGKTTLTGRELIRWKFKCFVRNPKLITYFDGHRGSIGDRIYTFMAYDLLDNGALYFAKRLFHTPS